MAPIMRDGMEYEFTTVFDLNMHHQAQTSKDRTNLFGDKIFTITEETGAQIMQWLNESDDHHEDDRNSPTQPVKIEQSFNGR